MPPTRGRKNVLRLFVVDIPPLPCSEAAGLCAMAQHPVKDLEKMPVVGPQMHIEGCHPIGLRMCLNPI